MLMGDYRLIVIPLSFLRRLDSLKYTSVIALISIGYLVILVVAHFLKGDTMQDRGEIRVIQWGGLVPALSSFPVIVFAYTCHQNVSELHRTRLHRSVTDSTSDVFDPQRDQQQLSLENVQRCRSQHRFSMLHLHLSRRYRIPVIRQQCKGEYRRNVYVHTISCITTSTKPEHRPTICRLDYRQSRHRRPRHVLLSPPSTPLQSLRRRSPQVAAPATSRIFKQLSLTRRNESPPSIQQERSSEWRRHGRSPLCRNHHRNHRFELHRGNDGNLARDRARVRREYRQYEHQLYPSGFVLLQDLVAGLATSSEACQRRRR